MKNQRGWVLWLFVTIACGGKSHTDDSSGGAGNTGAGAGAGAGNTSAGASSGDAGSCPDNSSVPSEGAPCPTPGKRCSGYGALSCPLTAVCSADSKWQITCSSSMLFGTCSCPHPDMGPAPDEHRTTGLACSHTRKANLPSADGGMISASSECSKDSDCVDETRGDNGRCMQQRPLPGSSCSYDTCFADSACESGSACQCREPGSVDANYCTVASNCRIDADCGTAGYCSPSQAHEWCGTVYACHTPKDECLNDTDCPSSTHCDFDVTAQHWACHDACGPVPP